MIQTIVICAVIVWFGCQFIEWIFNLIALREDRKEQELAVRLSLELSTSESFTIKDLENRRIINGI